MIKLFVTDLDGCIAHPFISPDLKVITSIKELNELSKTDPVIPPLSILSGRPQPYVEAVAQWLDIVDIPFLFESGGGMYTFDGNKLTWNPSFDAKTRQAIVELKEWLEEHIIDKYDGTIAEFTKFTDAGFINPNPEKIKLMHKEVLNYVKQNYPDFDVNDTEVSVNIISKKTNKGKGLRFLCDVLNLKPDEVAYIGDSIGDVPALEICGKSFAPLNASSHAKETADVVVKESTLGVLEAYEKVIEENRIAMRGSRN